MLESGGPVARERVLGQDSSTSSTMSAVSPFATERGSDTLPESRRSCSRRSGRTGLEERMAQMADGFLTRTTGAEEGCNVLQLLELRTGRLTKCDVVHRRAGEQRSVHMALPDGSSIDEASSMIDFEDVLIALRTSLEEKGLLLLCNRYRIDAFVSSMSRQMTDGLGCYIVESKCPVDPSVLVNALAPAPLEKVTVRTEAEEFISQWMASFDD